MRDLSHIKMFEGKKDYFGYCQEDLVCLFNSSLVSEEYAIRCFEREIYDNNVVVMTKKQWVNLFCNELE